MRTVLTQSPAVTYHGSASTEGAGFPGTVDVICTSTTAGDATVDVSSLESSDPGAARNRAGTSIGWQTVCCRRTQQGATVSDIPTGRPLRPRLPPNRLVSSSSSRSNAW
jgi:hypothetical protein